MEGILKIFYIAITLFSICIVVGVLFLGLSIGKQITGEGYEATKGIMSNSEGDAALALVKWQGKSIPAAACYTIIKSNPDLITSIKCNICGKTTVGSDCGDCLKTHLHGRLRLTFSEDENGAYNVVLS